MRAGRRAAPRILAKPRAWNRLFHSFSVLLLMPPSCYSPRPRLSVPASSCSLLHAPELPRGPLAPPTPAVRPPSPFSSSSRRRLELFPCKSYAFGPDIYSAATNRRTCCSARLFGTALAHGGRGTHRDEARHVGAVPPPLPALIDASKSPPPSAHRSFSGHGLSFSGEESGEVGGPWG